ncbi:MAG: tRNA pseudouridine(38-40) synthase TruA [Balneola sp.]|nr:MAG: tRNA pseudouridine(38-40) synthase TruA [Balneola sp.]
MPRYKLTIEYDGTNFSGWQVQPEARTVEGELEEAFSKVVQQPIDLIGQGRTDAGVHALGQIAHIDLPEGTDPDKLIFSANRIVSEEVFIHSIEEVTPAFHARFDATFREYEYQLISTYSPLNRTRSVLLPREYDSNLMHQAATLIKGEHDFAPFSKFNEDNYTTLCTVLDSEFEETKGLLIYRIRANRFLRNMVRRLVGTMIKIGEGKLSLTEFEAALSDPSYEIATQTAPANGLTLKKVHY